MKTATNDEDKKKGVLDGVDTSKLTAEFRYLGRIIGYKADALRRGTYRKQFPKRLPRALKSLNAGIFFRVKAEKGRKMR